MLFLCSPKIFAAGFALAALFLFHAAAAEKGEVVVFRCDFEKDPNLEGWRNLAGKAPLRSGVWAIREEEGNHFLRGNDDAGIFGITAPLETALEISPKVARVEVRARVRKPPKVNQLLRFGLTSRSQPEGRQGRAFEITRGSDSGFLVKGYQFSGDANGLEWSRKGLLRPYSEGFALLPDESGGWAEWKIVFDPGKHTLSFYSSFAGERPVLVQKGVALDGVTLRSLWLNGPGYTPPERRNPDAPGYVDYDDLSVSCTFIKGGAQ